MDKARSAGILPAKPVRRQDAEVPRRRAQPTCSLFEPHFPIGKNRLIPTANTYLYWRDRRVGCAHWRASSHQLSRRSLAKRNNLWESA